jgi:hypothetical protein
MIVCPREVVMQLPVLRRAFPAILCAVVVGFGSYQPMTAARSEKKAKPSVSVRASPTVGFSPARIALTAELKGGADDYEAFYCPSVEWNWGDDTRSESRSDCEPYEAGKSQIKRRFVIEHVFNTSGDFRVQFRLKQKNKVVGGGSADVKIRQGIRDGGQ